MEDLKTFRPSLWLEKGVRPAPFNWTSHRSPLEFITSPRYLKNVRRGQNIQNLHKTTKNGSTILFNFINKCRQLKCLQCTMIKASTSAKVNWLCKRKIKSAPDKMVRTAKAYPSFFYGMQVSRTVTIHALWPDWSPIIFSVIKCENLGTLSETLQGHGGDLPLPCPSLCPGYYLS